MARLLRLLLVEDDPFDEKLLLALLRAAGYDPVHRRVASEEEMAEALRSNSWDVVISDFYLPRFSGDAAWRLLQRTRPGFPFILYSGKVMFGAAEPLAGAPGDFVPKGAHGRLLEVLERKLATE